MTLPTFALHPLSRRFTIAVGILLICFSLGIAPKAAAQVDSELQFSTYLGGSEADQSEDIAVDNDGNIYVVGEAFGADFPATGTFPTQPPAIFVTKFDPTGTNVVYSIFLGGGIGYSIAVDSDGNAYVTGWTGGLVTTVNVFQPDYHGDGDAFVAKLDPSGTPVFVTYLGGAAYDYGAGLALDSNGNIIVVGSTSSRDFPVYNAYQSTKWEYSSDIFVTKLNPSGDALIFSTYFGGWPVEFGTKVALDGSGNIYVTGETDSPGMLSGNGFQPNPPGEWNALVLKFSPVGVLTSSTYLGGNGDSHASGIAVDADDSVVIVGWTQANSFPLKNPYQTTASAETGYIARLNSDLSQLLYSSYLGGTTGNSRVTDVVINNFGDIFVSGFTLADDFPILSPIQSVNRGSPSYGNTFAARFHSSGQSLQFATYLGGSADWEGSAAFLAIAPTNTIYVTGATMSNDFPVVNAFQPTPGGAGVGSLSENYDAYLARIDLLPVVGDVLTRNYFRTPTPVLGWTPISWATAYRLEVYALPQPDSGILVPTLKFSREVDASVLSLISPPLDDGLYHWRVQAQKPDGSWGTWNTPEPFVISTLSPIAIPS